MNIKLLWKLFYKNKKYRSTIYETLKEDLFKNNNNNGFQ